jgi:hypothetical protein
MCVGARHKKRKAATLTYKQLTLHETKSRLSYSCPTSISRRDAPFGKGKVRIFGRLGSRTLFTRKN